MVHINSSLQCGGTTSTGGLCWVLHCQLLHASSVMEHAPLGLRPRSVVVRGVHVMYVSKPTTAAVRAAGEPIRSERRGGLEVRPGEGLATGRNARPDCRHAPRLRPCRRLAGLQSCSGRFAAGPPTAICVGQLQTRCHCNVHVRHQASRQLSWSLHHSHIKPQTIFLYTRCIKSLSKGPTWVPGVITLLLRMPHLSHAQTPWDP